jgi:hypothetical protein
MDEKEWNSLPDCERVCESCQYPAKCEEYRDSWPRVSKMLCEVCSNTHLSKPVWHPLLFTDNEKQLFQSIAWIGNKILDKLKSGGHNE